MNLNCSRSTPRSAIHSAARFRLAPCRLHLGALSVSTSFHFQTPSDTQTVVVLPGGPFQSALIRKFRERGYRVICADRSPDCPGHALANHFIPAGLDEPERLLAAIRPLQPSAIVTDQTDSGVKTVAWLCEQLGLPGIGMECAELFTNKLRMREFCRLHGFCSPDFRVCPDLPAAQDAAQELGFPVVIKPLSNQSSKGVHCVNDVQELRIRHAETLRHTRDGRCLVEQFLSGTEFTVEGFRGATGHTTLAISEKRHYPDCPMVASSLEYLPNHTRFDYQQLQRVNDAWVNASELQFGITHAEYIFSRGDFYLIEIAARGGGTRIASDIVPWVSGVDPQLLLLEAALGGDPDPKRYALANRCALLEFFDFASGQVQQISGLEAARSFPGVLELSLAVNVGEFVVPVQDDTTRPGFFILTTDTSNQLHSLREQVIATVKVECE
jgi:biotin carboxylase